jgi:hypothetical protein
VTGLRRAPLLALAAAAAILAGCGNDSSGKGRLLSSQEANNLQDTLTRVQQDVAAKNCTAAGQEVAAFQQDVDSIRRLNRRLRSALRESSQRLDSLVADGCQTATAPAQTQTQTTPSVTGATGPDKAKEKKPKSEKPPKEKPTPPGQDGQRPPGQQDGGGAGVPGESGGDGTATP